MHCLVSYRLQTINVICFCVSLAGAIGESKSLIGAVVMSLTISGSVLLTCDWNQCLFVARCFCR